MLWTTNYAVYEIVNLRFLEEQYMCTSQTHIEKLPKIKARTEVIQRVEHPKNVQTIFDGLLGEIVDGVIPNTE
jgi:hypothetical protein